VARQPEERPTWRNYLPRSQFVGMILSCQSPCKTSRKYSILWR
jgi:hypothetical protein